MKVIVDTSALIALFGIDRFDLLRKLFTLVLVPRAVAEEYGELLPEWIKVLDVKNKQLVQVLLEYVHRGEAEAITLAIETNADILILDDKKARSIARRLGLKIIGTMGILVLAKKQKLIDDIETEINRLLQTSFYLSRDVITKALEISRKDC
ncbi:MAG: DUF3368 domain-containing protein [Desulfurococcales archaeon]|nr:DUF3368 domain-containing protein [Desulfurococcales archaeon]